MKTILSAVMFMDLHGWSRATDKDWILYAEKALPIMKSKVGKFDPIFSNTWGDSLFFLFSSCSQAAECALRIRDFFRESQLTIMLSKNLVPRISLHVGEVYEIRNPIIDRPDYYGESIHRTARIEPIVTPGSIWCTLEFKNQFQSIPSMSPSFHEIGEKALAKSYGKEILYEVNWPGESIKNLSDKLTENIGVKDAEILNVSRKHLISLAKRKHQNLKYLGENVLQPNSNLSDKHLITYGMTSILGTNILVEVFPVSETDYCEFCDATLHTLPQYLKNRRARDNYPIVFVSAFESEEFAKWLGKRLPTYEEWEKMAFLRPDNSYSDFPWGNRFSLEKCNCFESKIGELTPFTKYDSSKSFSGCYDVVGNMWEWCSDNVEGERIATGGSFYDSAKYCRRSQKISWDPADRVQDIGFRCVIEK